MAGAGEVNQRNIFSPHSRKSQSLLVEKATLSAGWTAPLRVTAPEVNQLLKVAAGTAQVGDASDGKMVWALAA
jgi:hypothetical protein